MHVPRETFLGDLRTMGETSADQPQQPADDGLLGHELDDLMAELPAADRERMAREVRLLLDVWRPRAGRG